MRSISEMIQPVIGLYSRALNNTNATGPYLYAGGAGGKRKIRATLNGGAMAATKTTILAIMQATDADGTGAKALSGATCTITANTLVDTATVDLTAGAATDVVTINGIVYTMNAATTVASRLFANAAGLVSCVNDATYGVPGVFASAAGAVVTLTARPAGETALTVANTDVAGTVVVATVAAQSYVEFDVSDLDLANNFKYFAAKVTTTANSNVAVTFDFVRAEGTAQPKVGASALL